MWNFDAIYRQVGDAPPQKPVLIAGPTASGKSDLALALAQRFGGTIVNADALQVYDCWRVLTARPSDADLARAPHALYGHVPGDVPYSVGDWLREVTAALPQMDRAIIVGGTGLYFRALTEGLTDIPAIAPEIRAQAQARLNRAGLDAMLGDLDRATLARIDTQNPRRVLRAWEVLQATGQSLAIWQDQTPPPLLPLSQVTPVHMAPDKTWLNARIARRFDQMLDAGALDEVRRALPHWDTTRPASQAIGAPELRTYLKGHLSLEAAKEQAIIATRQYAKRQRTWFRARMTLWKTLTLST